MFPIFQASWTQCCDEDDILHFQLLAAKAITDQSHHSFHFQLLAAKATTDQSHHSYFLQEVADWSKLANRKLLTSPNWPIVNFDTLD